MKGEIHNVHIENIENIEDFKSRWEMYEKGVEDTAMYFYEELQKLQKTYRGSNSRDILQKKIKKIDRLIDSIFEGEDVLPKKYITNRRDQLKYNILYGCKVEPQVTSFRMKR